MPCIKNMRKMPGETSWKSRKGANTWSRTLCAASSFSVLLHLFHTDGKASCICGDLLRLAICKHGEAWRAYGRATALQRQVFSVLIGMEAMLDAWGQRSVMMVQCPSEADSHCSHYRSPPAQSRHKCVVAPSNPGAPRRVLPHPSNHVWAQHCQGFTLGSSNTPGDICNALVHPFTSHTSHSHT